MSLVVRRCRSLLALLAVLFGAGEVIARGTIGDLPLSVIDWRLSRPLPWRQSSYWTPALVKEEAAIPWVWDDRGYLLPGDFSGSYFTFQGGIRHTVNQPNGDVPSLYLFGNSTLYDVAVPDALTIASQLQRLVPQFRVENYGMASATTAQMVIRLRTLVLRPGDLVVFYTGANDAQSVYNPAVNERLNNPPYPCATLWHRLSFLALVRLACTEVLLGEPLRLQEPGYVESGLMRLATAYHDNLMEARAITERQGATFLNVVQPYLWTKPLSIYEAGLIAMPEVIPPGQERIFSLAYPVLLRATGDVPHVDLTHSLDDLRRSGTEVYLDCCHVTEIADAVIAEALYQALFPLF